MVCRNAGQNLPVLGAVTFLRHQLPVPGENSVGLDDGGHLRQGLFAQLLANLGGRLAFPIIQSYAAPDLLAQDPVFCHEVLVAPQEFLIDRSCNIRQQQLPIHASLPSTSSIRTNGEYR
jgi:hypothetical protein